MLQAFQTYQIEEESARHVIPLATEVIHELRQLLIPPSKSPLPTPVKKAGASKSGTVRVATKKPLPSMPNRSVSGSGHPQATAVKALPMSKSVAAVSKKRRSSVIPVTEFDDIALLATMLCESPSV
jgi:hypothetical protein